MNVVKRVNNYGSDGNNEIVREESERHDYIRVDGRVCVFVGISAAYRVQVKMFTSVRTFEVNEPI